MTARQFYLTIMIFTFTIKIQKLPCLIYNQLGKESIVLLLIYFAIDILAMIVVYLLAQRVKQKKMIGKIGESAGGGVLTKILAILFCAYFFFQAAIFYEAIQDLFSHILFDNLSWTLFSLFLLFAIFLLAILDLKVIGRNVEIYYYIIVASVAILIVVGGFKADFSYIFPLETIAKQNYFKPLLEFNLWFGDYVMVFFLSLYSNKTSLKKTLASYVSAMLVVVMIYYVFYGVYLNFSGTQPSLITVIAEQSLLGVDLGQPQWFCVLLIEIGSVLGSALCFNLSAKFAKRVIPKASKTGTMLFLVVAMYLLDILYLVDTNRKEVFFLDNLSIYFFVLKVIFFVVLLAAGIYFCRKNDQKAGEL